MGDIIFKVINVSGGLGLFLLGMKLMGEGLELAAGSKLRTLLEKITSKKFIAMLVGLMVTAVIQSSSATDAMVVGFVNAGLMDIYQSIGILFGSKIGTTVTSLLLSFDIKAIVPIFTFAGAAVITFAKKNNYRYYGQRAAGFGILFMGMTVMSENFDFLKESPVFANTVSTLAHPVLGLLVGMIFTGIIQSSSASVGILMALGMSGIVSIDQCIYIIFGMNVGACVPVFLSAAGANRESKQVALSNFLTSLFAALLLSAVVLVLEPTSFSISGLVESVPFLKGNTAAQISAVHIAFNVARTIIFLPLSNLIIKFTKLILPDKTEEEEEVTVFLDSRILTTPPMAVQQTEKECARLASLARAAFDLAMEALLNGDVKAIERVKENETTMDKLTHGITKYIVKINGLDIIDYDRKVMGAMYNAIQDLERIGDRSENICDSAQELISGEAVLSDKAIKELRTLCEVVSKLLDDSFYMFINQSKDTNLTEAVLQAEDQIDEYCELFRQNHVNRLSKGECNAEAGAVFIELLTNLERIGDHAVTVAFCIPYKNHNALPQQTQ